MENNTETDVEVNISKDSSNEISLEDALRRATSLQEKGLVAAAHFGKGGSLTEFMNSLIDAQWEDSQLPEGVSRQDLKAGIARGLNFLLSEVAK